MAHSRQHDHPAEQAEPIESPSVSLTRREFFKSAGATGLAAAADQAPTSTYELFETLVIAKDRRDEGHR